MEQEITNKILQGVSKIVKQEIGSVKEELSTFKANTEKRFDIIEKELGTFKANAQKRFDIIEKELCTMGKELSTFKVNVEKRFDIVEKELCTIGKELSAFKVNAQRKFNTMEKELTEIKMSTCVMEQELTTKANISLETLVSANINYQTVRLDVAKLKEIAETHSMKIEFLQNKC